MQAMTMQKPIRFSQLDRTHHIMRGLEACWLYNEGVGTTVYDVSGNGRHAVQNGSNASWQGGTNLAGPRGWVMSFPSGGDYLAVASSAVFHTIPLSFAIWLKFDTIPSVANSNAYLFHKDDGTAANYPWRLIVLKTTDLPRFYVVDSNEAQDIIQAASAVVADTWYLYVGTIDSAGNAKLYINSVVEADIEALGTLTLLTSDGNVHIGAMPTSYFRGQVTFAAFWSRALAQTDINLLHREPWCFVRR